MFNRKDYSLIKSTALPAANANASSDAIDLGEGVRNCELELSVPALAALVAEKTLTVKVQECDTENGVYADAPWAGSLAVTGATGNGSAAASMRIGVASTAKRYIKAVAAVEASGGDNTASKFTVALMF